jgi:hypothetical protein
MPWLNNGKLSIVPNGNTATIRVEYDVLWGQTERFLISEHGLNFQEGIALIADDPSPYTPYYYGDPGPVAIEFGDVRNPNNPHIKNLEPPANAAATGDVAVHNVTTFEVARVVLDEDPGPVYWTITNGQYKVYYMPTKDEIRARVYCVARGLKLPTDHVDTNTVDVNDMFARPWP